MKTRTLCALVLLLVGCASTPPPDWRLNLQASMRLAIDAQLSGQDRVATLEFERAKQEIARTGRLDLLARAELMRCAAQVAALQFEPCTGYLALQTDAAPAERAYASYLEGRFDIASLALLPDAQRALAAAQRSSAADHSLLDSTKDPLSRLVGAALWLRDGRMSPQGMRLAVETASAAGWRRPLLAWLQLLEQQARQAGEIAEADRLARRIALVLSP